MRRMLLFIGLLVCAVVGIGIATAAYSAPTFQSLAREAGTRSAIGFANSQALSEAKGKGSNVAEPALEQAFSPERSEWGSEGFQRVNAPDPRFYGGKITALKPGAFDPGKSGGPVDNRRLSAPNSPLALPTFGTDVNISGGNEVFMASNPANPLNFLAGANINGRFTTTDGGQTWNVGSLSGGGDPAGAFDAAGRAYFAELGNTSSCPDLPVMYKSTNGGINWGPAVYPFTEPSPTDHFYDKEWITVDNYPTSPYFGRIYYTASNFHTPPGCNLNAYIDVAEKLTFSTDQGVTWSPSVNINDASHNQDQFTNPVAAPDGTLYVGYQYQNCTFNCTRDIPMVNLVARSTDGGVTFSPSITITGQPISITGAFVGGYQYLYAGSTSSGFRHNDQAIIGVAPNNSNQVYALWTDGRWDTTFVYQGITGNHGDILFSRSTDGGATWSAPIRVNDDALANGKDQFFPWMVVGSDGVIHASWMDRRDSGAGFQYREYYSQSSDGGLTWAANIPVSDVGGTPGSFIGDYAGLAVNGDNTLVLPIWTDSRAGSRAYTDRGVMGAGTATPTPTPCVSCTNTPTRTLTLTPTLTPTPIRTPTPTPSQCAANYICTTSPGATIVPGTTDTGNHGDDEVTSLTLPFPFNLYGVPYTSANISSNGNMQFETVNIAFTNNCLPDQEMGPAIFPFWDDLRTDVTGTCTGGCGIYTSISGSPPNRIFNIEWRTFYFNGAGNAYFEVRLYENSTRIDVIEGVRDINDSATVGVQDGAGRFTQCDCNGGGIPNNTLVAFTLGACSTPTTTPTSTPTHTSTSTHTSTPVVTVTPTFCRTSTPCPTSFSDVHPPDYFYTAVMYLACNGVISGYADGTFRPFNNTTRGQLTKIVVLAKGWTLECQGSGHFTDVPPNHTFFCYVETAVAHGIITGYADGTFRPGNNVTRGQLCKIIVLAMSWTLDCPPPGHFSDVPPDYTFFCYIETAYNHQIITGYDDGTFRPGNPATRGQICAIIYRALGPPCAPPPLAHK